MPKVTTVSAKVMRSYDYCHFEISMTADVEDTASPDFHADELRKTCARLTDHAVKQYKIARQCEDARAREPQERARLEREVAAIEQKPEEDRTPREMAKVKALHEWNWQQRFAYDYENEYEVPEMEEEFTL